MRRRVPVAIRVERYAAAEEFLNEMRSYDDGSPLMRQIIEEQQEAVDAQWYALPFPVQLVLSLPPEILTGLDWLLNRMNEGLQRISPK